MDYREFKRNIGKAGISVKRFAELIRCHPASITNLSQKGKSEKIPKNLAIIAVLIGEMKDNGLHFEELLANLDIEANQGRHENGFNCNRKTDKHFTKKVN